MPALRSLTIDRWYPLIVSSTDRKAFDEMPVEEQQARLAHDSRIPPELWSLPNLEELRFYDCFDPLNGTKEGANTFFRCLPQELTRLQRLKHLVISRCGLESVDEIQEGGPVAGKLTSENLDRSVLAKLTGLQTLGLPGNNLKRIPETIGYCTSLTRLSIGSNKLEYLPDAILNLSGLKELWASGNNIWRIPVSLPKYCPNLEDLRILQQGEDDKKSLLVPGDEKEIKALREAELAATEAKQKFNGTIKYMKAFLANNKTIRLNRYKLVVVGDGAVGKTTTIRRLQEFTASALAKKKKSDDNPMDNVATDGIEIQMLRLPSGAKKTSGHIGGNECLNFSCWDFAGQDVYTYSHTFFMSEKSVYLIGFDCALGDSSAGIERVDYWLQVVRSRFPNAYCIVFGTHIDTVGKEDLKILQKKITARYKAAKPGSSSSKDKGKGSAMTATSTKKDMFRVSGVEFVSNDSGKGLPDLLADIKRFPTFMEKTGRMKKNEDEIPISWLMLEERGKAKGATRLVPIMPWTDWAQLAHMELGMDEAQVRDATQHWHEAGSLSWFNEDGLRDIVCLRPDFLTDVFSAVISAKTGLSSGILRHEALIQIWKGLPLYLYPHMLTILEKFEILHKLEGGALLGQGGDLFGSGLDTPILTAADYMAAMNMTPNMPATHNPGVITASNGVVVDFGGALQPQASVAPVASNIAAEQARALFSGRSIIPAMLPEQEPPAAELNQHWPELPRGATELVRLYTFDFVPNGFFARLLVRLLHSKWRASVWWRWGIILSKNMAKLYLRYEGRTRTMSLRVRGPNNIAKVGSLIDSISTLIQDWLKQAEISIRIPYVYPDGTAYEFEWADVERAAQSGQMMVKAPGRANLPPVRIDNLAPDLALLTNSARIFSEQELKLGKELGRGAFGVVLRGTLPSGEPVACKKPIFDKAAEENGETTFSDIFTEFRREVWLMSGLQHPNLTKLIGVCTQPSLMMVLEFMEGGNLHEYLHGDESTPKPQLTVEDKFELALHVARGMQFMHSLNPPIIHRDLKSPNILLTFRNPDGGEKLRLPIPKIADFGLSRGMQWASSMKDKVVDNPVWLAPEVIMRKAYNEKVDVYSYGVILFEIVTQTRFLEEISFDYLKEDAIKQGKRAALPVDTNPILASLIQFCWAQDPNQRPSFDQVVECLEKRSIITSAKPSMLNYGAGFEEFDEEPVPPPAEVRVNNDLATLSIPPINTEEAAAAMGRSKSKKNLSSRSSARSSARSGEVPTTPASAPQLLSVPSQPSLNSAPVASSSMTPHPHLSTQPRSQSALPVTSHTSASVEVYTPLPTISSATATASNGGAALPPTGRKSGWNFATPQRSDSAPLRVLGEHTTTNSATNTGTPGS